MVANEEPADGEILTVKCSTRLHSQLSSHIFPGSVPEVSQVGLRTQTVPTLV